MNHAKNLVYNDSFKRDFHDVLRCISDVLQNPDTASKFADKLEGAILKRSNYPRSFERLYPYEGSPAYYRIYVDNYVVYYVVTDDEIMEVRRILYSSMNAYSRLY